MRITYVDNYDSFADIIAGYFENAGTDVLMYKSDCGLDIVVKDTPDLILLGPGPNAPRDSGNYLDIIDKYQKDFPIFGICLGFQAMMEYFGENVKTLDKIVHGKPVAVSHNSRGIFEGVNQNTEFARYNSLGVYRVPECFESTATQNGIVMAAKHKSRPIEGVQFHPDSFLSGADGVKLIENVVRIYSPK